MCIEVVLGDFNRRTVDVTGDNFHVIAIDGDCNAYRATSSAHICDIRDRARTAVEAVSDVIQSQIDHQFGLLTRY